MASAPKKIVFVGDVSVGKTSIVDRLTKNTYSEDYSVFII